MFSLYDLQASCRRDAPSAYHGDEGQYKNALWPHLGRLHGLDGASGASGAKPCREQGSVAFGSQRERVYNAATREPGDATSHDDRCVVPLFVEVMVRLVRGENIRTQSLMSRK